jgi:diaminohydroxyphosphoribosylaminopyrimidine deaminase/5-amino-6-(5-phosphoribosylamino)uracil reductase
MQDFLFMNDNTYMLEAVKLAKKGLGFTSPNPIVGAVIVKKDQIIGSGYHKKAGEEHAEINAINDAGHDSCKNACIYVTLEPCSSFGRTPPCVDAIIKLGFTRVVIGCLDPNPNHSGRGVDILKKAGIEVILNVEKEKCTELNEGFFHWIKTGMPFMLLKMGMTLDGKIATKNGQSKWITSADARMRVQELRKWSDAIMIGAETAKNDSPSLNIRDREGNILYNYPQPKRIIVSNSLSQNEAEVLMPNSPKPIIIAPKNHEEWMQILKQFASDNITSILIEGGGRLAANLIKFKLIDKFEFHIAPKILGGINSRSVISGDNPNLLSDALNLKNIKVNQLGKDISYTAYPAYP